MSESSRGLWGRYRADLVGAAVCALLTAGVYFGGVLPAIENHQLRQDAARELVERRAELISICARRTALERRLGGLRDELAEMPLRLSSASRLNHQLAELTSLVSRCGLTLDMIEPAPAEDLPLCRRVPLLLRGRGTYPACAAFAHALRDRFADTGIQTFELQAPPTPEQEQGVFHFGLVWYTRLPAMTDAGPRVGEGTP